GANHGNRCVSGLPYGMVVPANESDKFASPTNCVRKIAAHEPLFLPLFFGRFLLTGTTSSRTLGPLFFDRGFRCAKPTVMKVAWTHE
ncbi:MAG TPA: hypothetical protein P5026_07610, partial [Kiritimatiellia bacterium]|nr:hypothetical protein [Kiritimatiellia bacterium]HRU70022.1 hypothetical protein [Kiritimatiellia bacterium]